MILYIMGLVFAGLAILALVFRIHSLPPTILGLYALTSFIIGLLRYSNLKFIFMVRYFFYIITGFTMAFIPFILLLLSIIIGMKLWQKKEALWNQIMDGFIMVIFILIAGITIWALFNLTDDRLNQVISIYTLITMFFLSSFISFIMINGIIHYFPNFKTYQTLIILGLRLEKENQVPSLLIKRLDKGIEIYRRQVRRHKIKPQIIVSGGTAGHISYSEASMMASYLVAEGIPREQIVIEPVALNTEENLALSRNLIQKHHLSESILVITSRFHLLRTAYLAGGLNFAADYTGARASVRLWPYQIVREYLAYFVLTKEWQVFYIIFLIYFALNLA